MHSLVLYFMLAGGRCIRLLLLFGTCQLTPGRNTRCDFVVLTTVCGVRAEILPIFGRFGRRGDNFRSNGMVVVQRGERLPRAKVDARTRAGSA